MAQILKSALATVDLFPSVTAVERQLQRSPYWSVRQLICYLEEDRVVVCGTVSSFYLKQIAQSLACKAVGAECVESHIEVLEE
jgi:hypothetical protein